MNSGKKEICRFIFNTLKFIKRNIKDYKIRYVLINIIFLITIFNITMLFYINITMLCYIMLLCYITVIKNDYISECDIILYLL